MSRSRSFRTAIVVGAAFIGLALPATAQAAKNWAVVQGDGTLVRGNGVTTVTHPNTGVYIATFAADVHGCAYVGNPWDPSIGDVSTSSTVTVAHGPEIATSSTSRCGTSRRVRSPTSRSTSSPTAG